MKHVYKKSCQLVKGAFHIEVQQYHHLHAKMHFIRSNREHRLSQKIVQSNKVKAIKCSHQVTRNPTI